MGVDKSIKSSFLSTYSFQFLGITANPMTSEADGYPI